MKLSAATLSLCIALFHVNAAQAEDNWLTLVGDPKDQTADYIQLDPSGLSRDRNRRVVPVRVSRAHARTSKEGIVFRSVEGVAAIDCVSGSARILKASFYAEANFKGTPIRVEIFKPGDVRPMAFRDVSGQPAQRVVRAACNTRIASN